MLPKINSIKDILKFALINFIASNILFLRLVNLRVKVLIILDSVVR